MQYSCRCESSNLSAPDCSPQQRRLLFAILFPHCLMYSVSCKQCPNLIIHPRSVSPVFEWNECLNKLHCKSYAVDLIDLVFPILSPQLVAAMQCTYQDPLQKMQIQSHPGTFAKIARILLLHGSFITCKLPELRKKCTDTIE